MRVMNRLISAYLSLCNKNEIAAMVAGLSAFYGGFFALGTGMLGISYLVLNNDLLFYLISISLLLPAAYILYFIGSMAVECMWAIFGVYRVFGIEGRPIRNRVARYLKKEKAVPPTVDTIS